MNATYEKLEKNQVKLTFGVDASRFEEGIKYSYNKNKGKINVPGFRAGKAPRKIIEVNYGKEIFYDDAVNFCVGDAYEEALIETGIEPVSKPELDVLQIDKEKGIVFEAVVTVKPPVTVSDYKGITYKKPSLEATEEDIMKEIEKDRKQNARTVTITDRPVQDGDTVTIDYKGFIDGVPFDGGEDKDHDLKIGSHTFIDTFEEQLIGKNIGDDVEVKVTFPEAYHAPDLAGKEALFEVEIKDINVDELPEIDDDFAADVSEYETLAEYKTSIKERLEKEKADRAKSETEEQIMKQLIANTEIDVPNIMIENQIDSMVERFTNNVRMQGLSAEMYLQYMGQTMDGLRNAYREPASEQVRGRLCLEAVAVAENITASDDEIKVELERIAEKYKMDVEQLNTLMGHSEKTGLATDLAVQKALEFLVENAVEIQ